MNTMTRRGIDAGCIKHGSLTSMQDEMAHPVLLPMHGSEFEGAGAIRWIVASAIVGVILCTKLIVGLLL